eukprot:TRINITY_DN35900_c0_g1_i1.p1 TRINITY_DN35900_c0_g1~~TRINITY_DN35900_c0_g1_i1.p1  ORF type:complete len:1051 (+),score=292.44 TRINITY_DN35900_c0_g1_i1:56-3208(+)
MRLAVAALLCLGLVPSSGHLSGAPPTVPACGTDTDYFDEATLRCRPCSDPSRMLPTADGKGCRCRAGYATRDCSRDCVQEGLAADKEGSRCLPCAAPSVVDTSARDCTCNSSGILVDQLSGSPLPERLCVQCDGYITPEGLCRSCAAIGRAKGAGACPVAPCCGCPDGTFLFAEGSHEECLPADPQDTAFRLFTSTVWYPGVAAAQQSAELQAKAPLAYARCVAGVGGVGGCAMLANLCVAQVYDVDAAAASALQMAGACGLYNTYLELQDGGTGCSQALGCQQPRDLPWLFYQSASGQMPFSRIRRTMRYGMRLGDSLRLFVRSYTMEGEYLGAEPLLEQLSLCEVDESVAASAWQLGTNMRVGCRVNAEWLAAAARPIVYEVFAEVPDRNGSSIVVDVPVRMAGTGWATDPFYADTFSAYQSTEERLYRRFVLYEHFLAEDYLRFVSELYFMAALRDQATEELLVPLLTVKYSTLRKPAAPSPTPPEASSPPSPDPLSSVLLPQPPGDVVPRTVLGGEENCMIQVLYVSDQSKLHKTMLDLIISACCVSVLTSGIKMYTWSTRNGQSNGPLLLPRFFVYYCSHFANSFLILVCSIGLWFLCFFKFQSATSVMLPPVESLDRLFTVLLWCSFATKFVDVLYHVWEQCRQWIFLVDWETPRQQDAPVPMWRLAFVANELNELQGMRAGRPGTALVLMVFLLQGPAELQGLSSAQPDTNDLEMQGSFSHPLLRIGVATVVFLFTTACCRMFDAVYYRFCEVEPLRQLAELCSVANVSVFFVLEERWGFYLHGKSVHPHADTSLREFQDMLKREEEDRALPRRGLGGKSDCQCFEMFLNWSLHQDLTQRKLEMDKLTMAMDGRQRPQQHVRLADYCGGTPRNPVMSPELLKVFEDMSRMLQRLVQQEEASVLPRTAPHRLMGLPDQKVRIADFQDFTGTSAGAFAQGAPTTGLAPGRITLYADAPHWPKRSVDAVPGGWQQTAPAQCFLWGLDGALFCLSLATYLAFDYRFQNAYGAAVACYLVNALVVWLRRKEGQANLGRTSFIDERFFL